MLYECDPRLSRVTFEIPDCDEVMLAKTCAANEHATYPPVAFLRLKILNWAPVQVRNKTGVTVLQVMRSICNLFYEHNDWLAWSTHTGWTDWDSIELDRNGNILLSAYDFQLT